MFIKMRDIEKDYLHYVNIEHVIRFIEVPHTKTRNGKAVLVHLVDGKEILTDSIMDNIYNELDNKHLMI